MAIVIISLQWNLSLETCQNSHGLILQYGRSLQKKGKISRANLQAGDTKTPKYLRDRRGLGGRAVCCGTSPALTNIAGGAEAAVPPLSAESSRPRRPPGRISCTASPPPTCPSRPSWFPGLVWRSLGLCRLLSGYRYHTYSATADSILLSTIVSYLPIAVALKSSTPHRWQISLMFKSDL